MCGLVCVFKKEGPLEKSFDKLIKNSLQLLNHRGPDESEVYRVDESVLFAHARLSIVGLEDGRQPLKAIDRRGAQITWVHNGEIYNHKDLRKELALTSKASHCDSVVIGEGYLKWGVSIFDKLDGVFATVLYHKGEVIAARDPLGVKPLYFGESQEGVLAFASEMKALQGICDEVHTFPAGHYYTREEGFVCYYRPRFKEERPELREDVFSKLESALRKSVKKRLMADVEVGALLSGGLDSSLVAAIACQELKKKGKKLHTFSVGLDPLSDDLKYARMVSEHIGSIHHEIIFTEEEGMESLSEMIYHLETFDITTVRASTPMFIMAKKIRELGIKVVLSGEGADEIFGGYLYFRNAPGAKEFHKECVRRVGLLYSADLLRADRSTMGAGVEARVPFLDKEFLELSMSIDPELKMVTEQRCEKWILRQAFSKEALIPDEILWRQKEQFSDGVGYSWVDRLKEHAESLFSDRQFEEAKNQYKHLPPVSKEALMYRMLFEKHYPLESIAVQSKAWIPKWQENSDPSGRANTDHIRTTEKKSFTLSA